MSMDTLDRREWLDRQSEDAVVTELCWMEQTIESLQVQLAQAEVRVAEAERLLRQVPHFLADEAGGLDRDIDIFLSPTPTPVIPEEVHGETLTFPPGGGCRVTKWPDPELCIRCGKAKATRCTPEGICEKCWQEEFGTPEEGSGEMVMVTAEDVREILAFMRNSKRLMKGEITQFQYEAMHRLQAALGEGGKI